MVDVLAVHVGGGNSFLPARGTARAGRLGRAETGAVEDDLVGAMGETVQGAVRQDRIIEQSDPFVDRPVTGEDRGGPPVPLDEDIVEVARLLGGELAQAEVVEDEQVGGQPGPEFSLEGVIGAGLVEGLEQLRHGDEADPVAGAAGAVAEGTGEEGLADADGTAEDDVFLRGEPVEGKEGAARARSKLTGLSQTIASKVAASSKPAVRRRRVSPWLSRRSISSWRRSSRNSP